MRKIKMFSGQADCVGGCPAPPAKVGADKAADSYYNKDRVSRATAFSNYARSPRALAPAGAPTPAAPSILRVEGASSSEIAVYFAPPPGAVGAVLGYVATAVPGGASAAGSSPPITVGGLEPDTAYWFTVRALRADGSAAVSAMSAAATTLEEIYGVMQFAPNTIFNIPARDHSAAPVRPGALLRRASPSGLVARGGARCPPARSGRSAEARRAPTQPLV